MSHLVFFPQRNVFGPGAVAEIGGMAKDTGMKKPLIVTDQFLVSTGTVGKVQEYLTAAGIEAAVFDGTEPNPSDKNVDAGVAVYKENSCDSVISVGGGSAHDCAKGIGIVVANGGNILDYNAFGGKPFDKMVPLIAVNTTAGTGSDAGKGTVITDSNTHVKIVVSNWRIFPAVAINDPELMVGKPAALTAATGIDAFVHAVESYLSRKANEISDIFAVRAIELCVQYLPRATANGQDLEARDKMAYAQYMAGIAFGNASLGLVHAMAHMLGGMYDLPHGVCNAVLLPYIMEYNILSSTQRLAEVAVMMGECVEGLSEYEAAKKAVAAMQLLCKRLNIPSNLKELGVKEADFAYMAENALKDFTIFFTPRPASKEQIIALFQKAYNGEQVCVD